MRFRATIEQNAKTATGIEVPADAKRVFDDLSYSKKQRFVLPIEDAKTAETRQRRIDNAVIALREGRSP